MESQGRKLQQVWCVPKLLLVKGGAGAFLTLRQVRLHCSCLPEHMDKWNLVHNLLTFSGVCFPYCQLVFWAIFSFLKGTGLEKHHSSEGEREAALEVDYTFLSHKVVVLRMVWGVFVPWIMAKPLGWEVRWGEAVLYQGAIQQQRLLSFSHTAVLYSGCGRDRLSY